MAAPSACLFFQTPTPANCGHSIARIDSLENDKVSIAEIRVFCSQTEWKPDGCAERPR